METVEFERGGGSVELGIAEDAAQAGAVGADLGSFGGGEFFDAILQLARGGGLADGERARLVLAKFIELRDGLLHQVQPFGPFGGRAGWLGIGGGQDDLLIADGGEKMFSRGGIHERVCPGEDDIHAVIGTFHEVEAHQFAARGRSGWLNNFWRRPGESVCTWYRARAAGFSAAAGIFFHRRGLKQSAHRGRSSREIPAARRRAGA